MHVASRNRKTEKKYELLKTSWTYQTKQFFHHSTLHGVRYIAEENRPFCEKFLWFCCTVIGFIATLVIITSLWEKFQTNPTITGLDTDFHNWDVPFPAVTICQMNPVNEEYVDQLMEKKFKNIQNPEEQKVLKEYLTELGRFSYDRMDQLTKFAGKSYLPQTELRNLSMEVVYHCEDILSDCKWKDSEINCCDVFFPMVTETGLCYSFNSYHIETTWPWMEKIEPITRRKMEFIYETDDAWSIVFNVKDVQTNAAHVYIHSYREIPGVDLVPQHTWTRRINRISFSAKTTYTTDNARQLSIRQRKCVFEDEWPLITDTVYTYGACMRECRMELAYKECKCVPFFYPQVKEFVHCDLQGLKCLDKVRKELMKKTLCGCELGCSNTVYEIEKLNDGEAKNNKNSPLDTGFVSWPMIQYKREVLFGWVDLLVAFGGIAGLFLGFSLLSGVEIVYYFTMRACCMYSRDQDELKKLKEEYEREDANHPPPDLSLVPTFMRKNSNKDEKVSTPGISTIHPRPFTVQPHYGPIMRR